MATTISMLLVALFLCVLLAAGEEVEQQQCPPWHFTPDNASKPCSQCGPLKNIVRCHREETYIQIYYCMTAMGNESGGYQLTVGKCYFGLDRSRGLLKNWVFRQLPTNVSEVNEFACNSTNRKGYFCADCKKDYGIAVYRYYGLPCAPCYDYGIALYLLLEVGFSTLFFVLVFAARINVNSGKWIGFIFYCHALAGELVDSMLFTIAFQRNSSAALFLFTSYGIGNMDFFRRVIRPFCVSQKLSTLGAITCGYISAVWPLILILLVSLAMELNKRDFKVAVYPWKFIDRVSFGVVQQWFAQTNPVHIFATFFILSYSKILFVSFSLLKITYPQQLSCGNANNLRPLSVDPHIHYFSRGHLPYVVPAITIIVTLGVLLPLLLMLYPTRCGSRYFGGRIIVKTFIEAFQGSYKDGTNGTRDYRAVSALYLICRVVVWTFTVNFVNQPTNPGGWLIVSALYMLGVAFFGFVRPYKSSTHNLLDVLILTLLAVQAVYASVLQGITKYGTHELDTQIALGFLPLLAVSVYTLGRVLRLPVRFIIKRMPNMKLIHLG